MGATTSPTPRTVIATRTSWLLSFGCPLRSVDMAVIVVLREKINRGNQGLELWITVLIRCVMRRLRSAMLLLALEISQLEKANSRSTPLLESVRIENQKTTKKIISNPIESSFWLSII